MMTVMILWFAMQPTEVDAARKSFESAKREYNIGQFDRASRLFEEAYRISGDPILLYNIAQSHRQFGRRGEAIQAYKAYLREVPTADNRVAVEARIKDLESSTDRGPAPTAFDLVDPEVSPSRFRRPPTVPVPSAAITTKSQMPDPTPRKSSYMRTKIATGAAILLGAAALGTGLAAEAKHSEMVDGCARNIGGCSDPEVASLKSRAMVTNMLLGLTAGAVVTAGVFFWMDRSSAGVGGRF